MVSQMKADIADQRQRAFHQLAIGTVIDINKSNLPYTADVQVQEAQSVYTLTDCLIVQPIMWPAQGGLVLFPRPWTRTWGRPRW